MAGDTQNIPDSLIALGISSFGTTERFFEWLNTANFYFDKKAPVEFCSSPDGVKFISDRLIGIQYGDNA